MQTVFVSELRPFLDAVAEQMDLYVPKKAGMHYVYSKYDPASETPVPFNNIRACTPVKEFLFPLRELAAVFPEPLDPEEIKPFAVFGLKDCDLRSIEVLDKVFTEEEFKDPFYVARREKMFIISSDCYEPGDSCWCTFSGGQPHAEKGFDLNVSMVGNGFVIEVGSDKGSEFVEKTKDLFAEVPAEALAERDAARAEARKRVDEYNAQYGLDKPGNEIVEGGYESDVFDIESQKCVECQACTRVCPTCHCFYLYDTKRQDYFAKMKMWDSCMRLAYAEVAGGENPRKVLGDRIRHRFMHKFAYFLDRYGINMCVGCGRCIDADSHRMDLRVVLKKLNEELKGAKEAKVAR